MSKENQKAEKSKMQNRGIKLHIVLLEFLNLEFP